MNPQITDVLVGESTVNLVPFAGGLPPVLRRPDATIEIPVCPEPEPAPARRMDLATGARAGHGRHELAEPWRVALAAELVLAVALAVVITVLVVGL